MTNKNKLPEVDKVQKAKEKLRNILYSYECKLPLNSCDFWELQEVAEDLIDALDSQEQEMPLIDDPIIQSTGTDTYTCSCGNKIVISYEFKINEL